MSSACYVEPQEYGRVQVVAVDATGAQISNVGVNVLEARARKLPFGVYVLRIVAPGFRFIEREIRLYQPEMTIRAELDVATECGGFATVHGSVSPVPRDP
jgi:hypothetical protein